MGSWHKQALPWDQWLPSQRHYPALTGIQPTLPSLRRPSHSTLHHPSGPLHVCNSHVQTRVFGLPNALSCSNIMMLFQVTSISTVQCVFPKRFLDSRVYLSTSLTSCPHPQSTDSYYLVRRRWAGLPPGSVAIRRRAVGCGGQRRRDRSSSCSGTKGRRGPRSGEFPRLLERGGGWAGGVALRGALLRGHGGSTATFRTGERGKRMRERTKEERRKTTIARAEKPEPLDRAALPLGASPNKNSFHAY